MKNFIKKKGFTLIEIVITMMAVIIMVIGIYIVYDRVTFYDNVKKEEEILSQLVASVNELYRNNTMPDNFSLSTLEEAKMLPSNLSSDTNGNGYLDVYNGYVRVSKVPGKKYIISINVPSKVCMQIIPYMVNNFEVIDPNMSSFSSDQYDSLDTMKSISKADVNKDCALPSYQGALSTKNLYILLQIK